MPVFDKGRFVEAVEQVVSANAAYVPPYGSGATLYIRPYMFGISPVIGVKPAEEYQFRVFCTPVGPYFKGGVKPLTIKISDFDRAAPHGTGNIKAGLNYAMSLHAIVTAHEEGYDENMYLDPGTRTKVEETGGANFLFVTKDGKVVTPKSDSILPSITRRSLVHVAKEYLGLTVEERGLQGRAYGYGGMRLVRYGSRYLSRRQNCGPRQRNLYGERHERDGTCHEEALRYADRHPDGTHRSA